ncbi:MAG TPA: YtxH domain-containing protein [Bacteroidota bacterium]|jgi:gas vesicle protein|nr:YtxH domain-containing protein [Bacteroidota bacterium]
MKTRNIVLGFLSGAAVGSIVALLYAPQKGEHLRAEINRKAARVADDVNEYLRHAATRTSDALRNLTRKPLKAA